MKEVKKEQINTNNAWGFGGAIYTRTHYDNGLFFDSGKCFYRHLKPTKLSRWGYNGEPDMIEEDSTDPKKLTPNHEFIVVYFEHIRPVGAWFDKTKIEIPKLMVKLGRRSHGAQHPIDFKIITQ